MAGVITECFHCWATGTLEERIPAGPADGDVHCTSCKCRMQSWTKGSAKLHDWEDGERHLRWDDDEPCEVIGSAASAVIVSAEQMYFDQHGHWPVNYLAGTVVEDFNPAQPGLP